MLTTTAKSESSNTPEFENAAAFVRTLFAMRPRPSRDCRRGSCGTAQAGPSEPAWVALMKVDKERKAHIRAREVALVERVRADVERLDPNVLPERRARLQHTLLELTRQQDQVEIEARS